MTDTTKPNGDRDRPCDREAAKNPRGPAMGPPEGTASSGSTSPPLDMALQRELAKEFGFYPATTNPEDIERHRRLNARRLSSSHLPAPAGLAALRGTAELPGRQAAAGLPDVAEPDRLALRGARGALPIERVLGGAV
jgi:hypothetical protein